MGHFQRWGPDGESRLVLPEQYPIVPILLKKLFSHGISKIYTALPLCLFLICNVELEEHVT